MVDGNGKEEAEAAWAEVADEPWFTAIYQGIPFMDRDRLLGDPRGSQYITHSKYDPAHALEHVSIPMLAVFGSDDQIIPVEESIEGMKSAFDRSGLGDFEYRVFDGADHGMSLTSATGERSFATGFLDYMYGWIGRIVGE